MKISFWIPAIVLFAVSIKLSNAVQVGTVLFSTTDLVRKCWTENEKSVLRARLIMQDVLPDPDCIDFSNPKAAVVLLDYFLACFEIISRSCYGRVQNLMFIALSDALGGYLRAYVLPATKRAYYAGQMKYVEAEQVFRLYDNIKAFLKTTGGGWALPQKLSRRNFRVAPLVITGGDFEACKLLRIIQKRGKLHCINPHYSCKSPEIKNVHRKESRKEKKSDQFKNSTGLPKDMGKMSIEERMSTKEGNRIHNSEKLNNFVESFMNVTVEDPENLKTRRINVRCNCPKCNRKINTKRVIVPLPMLDDRQNPQSIVVPFKIQPFRNLNSPSSAFILEYYYIAVIKCFIAKGNTLIEIKNFNAELLSWLISEVLPHLNDEKWYPGFGGVLRIIETIKKFGTNSGLTEPCLHDTSYVFAKGFEFEADKKEDQPRNAVGGYCPNTKRHVITAIVVVSLLWMFLFCACGFYFQAMKMRGSCTASARSCPLRRKRQPCADANKEKNISFQFLIRFFKKCTSNQICSEKEKLVCWNVRKLDKKDIFKDKYHIKSRIKRALDMKYEEPKHPKDGRGDFTVCPVFKQEEVLKKYFPTWCFGQSCVTNSGGDAEQSMCQEQQKDVRVLWMKPSIKLKEINERPHKEKSHCTKSSTTMSYSATGEDSKTYSTSKQDECCSCSESCQHTLGSCTGCSEHSKSSSSTVMKCLEDDSRKKKYSESAILVTTDESEYNGTSMTDESDY